MLVTDLLSLLPMQAVLLLAPIAKRSFLPHFHDNDIHFMQYANNIMLKKLMALDDPQSLNPYLNC